MFCEQISFIGISTCDLLHWKLCHSHTVFCLCQAARSLKAFSLLSLSSLVSWFYFADRIEAFTGKQWPLSLGLLPQLATNFAEWNIPKSNQSCEHFPPAAGWLFLCWFCVGGAMWAYTHFQWYLFQINLNETTNDWEWKENNVMDCVERILSLTIVIMVLRIRQFKSVWVTMYGIRLNEWTNKRTNDSDK